MAAKPPGTILLCGDCGMIPLPGIPYQSSPAHAAYEHNAETGHAVAIYVLSDVVGEAST